MLFSFRKKKAARKVILGWFCTGGNRVRSMQGSMGVLALRGNYQDDEEESTSGASALLNPCPLCQHPPWWAPRGQRGPVVRSFAAKQWERLLGLQFHLSSSGKVPALWFPFRVQVFQIEQPFHRITQNHIKTGAGTVLRCCWALWDAQVCGGLEK